MTTFEPWAVGDTSSNVGSRSATTAVLNAGIESLAVTKDTLGIIPVKAVFESVIGILNIVRVRVPAPSSFLLLIFRRHNQDEMIDDDAFVELAKCCVRACHVLKTTTEGRGMDSLSGPVKKATESLEKYVIPARLSLSIITSEIRTIRYIESNLKASDSALGVNHLRECHPGSNGACLILWKMEIQKILGIFDVCGCHFGVRQFLNCLRVNRSLTMSS